MNNSARILAALLALLSLPAMADGNRKHVIFTRLVSYQEVPAISSTASGQFRAFIDEKAGTISYRLSFEGLSSDVRQSHIHFGQHSVNGAVSVFLCQTATNPDPTGLAPQCPQSGTVTGLLQAANMAAGTTAQGIAPGEFAELLAAIRAGVAYVNVHTATFTGGEIRGQLRDDFR
jgi:CHRD domain-containing protein